MSTGIKRKRVLIVGAGAAGTAAAFSLSKSPDKFQVEVWDRAALPGGVATSERLEGEGDLIINDGVQAGCPSYRNTLNLMSKFGFSGSPIQVRIVFGKDSTAWTNYSKTKLTDYHRDEIKKFGKVLGIISKFEFIFVFISISRVLKMFNFSNSFCYQMVFPLTALFFGTGNQTPQVSSAIIARVFLDDSLRLFEYDNERLLAQKPLLFSFPNLRNLYQTIMSKTGCAFHPNRAVASVSRKEGKVFVVDDTQGKDVFDEIIFSCDTETILSVLQEPSFMERQVLGNVEYYNDVTVTHEDGAYMDQHYETNANDDHYYIRSDDSDPTKLEMSFNLTNYQPQLKGSGRNIYQTIFLNNANIATWTINKIDKRKILLTKWWRKFCHTCRHFAFTVLLLRYIQGTANTWYCGAYTMVGTHEAAIISGFAAASRIGGMYPFPEDDLARTQFEQYLSLIHGRSAKYSCNVKTIMGTVRAAVMFLYLMFALFLQFLMKPFTQR